MQELVSSKSEAAVSAPARWRDYVTLCKPRIATMVVLTVFVGGLLSGLGTSLGLITSASIGVLLIAASGCAMNQYVERYTDFLMFRTRSRPLPGGRLSAHEVVVFGSITLGIGFSLLAVINGWQVALLGLANWLGYVVVYTPLKRWTVWNTMVGAIAGALPILIGAAAVPGQISPSAWWFFAVLVVWQFPHFMSIAWLYREDYREGGIRMISVVKRGALWTGVWAIGFCLILFPISILPAAGSFPDWRFWFLAIVATALNCWFLLACIRFSLVLNDPTRQAEDSPAVSRRLLRVSLMYLPLYMVAVVVACMS